VNSKPRTCVTPAGEFVHGIHKPAFTVANLRDGEGVESLGSLEGDGEVRNLVNFPAGDVHEPAADWIYEIPNPLPFRGTTYIGKGWADRTAEDPSRIGLPQPGPVSMTKALAAVLPGHAAMPAIAEIFAGLPQPVLLALAATSTDPDDLVRLARLSCRFAEDSGDGPPAGLLFRREAGGRVRPAIDNHDLFETLVNNPYLPDGYKEAMVLRPGVQGDSEIVGEWRHGAGHAFEYLRRNSYIPWGHYAANMANDAVRYRIVDLGEEDILGLRHLYYQRTYMRLAEELGLTIETRRRALTATELEDLRQRLLATLRQPGTRNPAFDATLWGWNFGFDFAASGYRLHASHQQIHQQYALVPAAVPTASGDLPSYACGDLIADFVARYRQENGSSFFDDYLRAIANNRRLDGRDHLPASLVVHEDEQVILFVPKAQTSQWELQLMTVAEVGNVVEADTACRLSLDLAMRRAQQIYAALGARLVTTIEFGKRLTAGPTGQRLLYSFLPKLPHSMGGFSEAQLRFINGHYPEDFAAACRGKDR